MRGPAARLAIAGCLAALAVGCAGWPGTGSGQASGGASGETVAETLASQKISRVELRLRLERFADQYYEEVWQEIDRYVSTLPNLQARRGAIEAKYSLGMAVISIASGPYPTVSLLDMLSFVSLQRMASEAHAIQTFGPAAAGVVEVMRRQEQGAWENLGSILSEQQRIELRKLIDAWQAANPGRLYVENVRFADFAEQLQGESREEARGLLASVQHAAATADQALELAERLTYFFQRAPMIWRLHAQLAYFEVMGQPEMQGLVANVNQVSSSAERISLTLEELSDALMGKPGTDQEALLANLDEGEQRARGLLVEMRQTLETTDAVLRDADALATKFNVGVPSQEPSKPFDIAEYEHAALEFSSMAVEFRQLVESTNALLSSPVVSERLPSAVDTAASEGEDLLEYAVILAIVVIAAFVLALLGAMLGYRYLTLRMIDRIERRHS